MEHTSDTVFQGKLVGEGSYERRRKEVDIDGKVVLDGFDRQRNVVYEVKKSKSVEKAHIWQTKYYLYFLKQLGVVATGEIDYPLLRSVEKICLSDADESSMRGILLDIQKIIDLETAPDMNKKSFCRKCAYYEFCFV